MRRRFERRIDALGSIFEFTRTFFQGAGVGEEDRFAVDLAVEEVFTNCVKFHPESREKIEIGLIRSDDGLRIEMTDFDVEPFDVTAVEPLRTDLPLEERRVGGLGIHLTRTLMDALEYDYRDRTSTIIMTKNLR